MACGGTRRFCLNHLSAMFVRFLLISLIAPIIYAFNVDVDSPIVFSNTDPESQFGFSVALHRYGQENMLLVGAPKSESSAFDSSQGVERSGAVFKCPIDTSQTTSQTCTEIIIDNVGHEYDDSGVQVTNASGQWLGSTLESGGPDGSVVVCRPLYTRKRYTYPAGENRDFQGGCYVTNDVFSTIHAFEPCRTPATGLSYLEYRCEFGVSAAIKENEILYGASGSILWNGKIWHSTGSEPSTSTYLPSSRSPYSGRVYYFGQAVAMGNFKGDGELEYVISAPRQDNGFGRVYLHDRNPTSSNLNDGSYLALADDVLGSSFGHALSVSDLNNDGWEDLVISAPLFTDPDRSVESAWEVGKVFIYYNNKQGGFLENPDTATGTDPGCRYGYSLAALGDINQDGFNDLAVGAPFCSSGMAGKVYIYHGAGNNRPLNLSPKQILSPESLRAPFEYLGFAISAGIDIDGNGYPDLSVGAHGSQNALVFRSRAVAIATAEIFGGQSAIDPDIKNDLTSAGTSVTGFDVQTCFRYSGVGLPNQLEFSYEILLDSARQPQSRRAFLKDSSTSSYIVDVTLGQRICVTHRAYVNPNIRDKQSAMAMLLTYNLPVDPAETLPPILADSVTTQVSSSIGFLRECAGAICFPNLAVSATTDVSQLTIGVSQAISLDISVANNGEDSFLSVLEIWEPEGINFVSMDRMASGSFATCSYSSLTRVRSCDIGNPISAGEGVTIGLHYQSEDYSVFDDDVIINMTVSSVDPELPSDIVDNNANVVIPVYAKASISLTGLANPDRLILREGDYPPGRNLSVEAGIGPQITHNLTLLNKGPSFIGATSIVIFWPMRDENAPLLINVTGVAMDRGQECSISSYMNPEYLSSTPSSNATNTSSLLRADCETFPECWRIQCPVTSLAPEATAVVTIVTRVIADTSLSSIYELIEVVSTASAVVEGSIYSPRIQYLQHPTVQPLEIETELVVEYNQVIVPVARLPLWVYLVSALGGVIILIVLILILYKVGFFKRKHLTIEQRSLVRQRHTISKGGGEMTGVNNADLETDESEIN